jgi:hypothetical protein
MAHPAKAADMAVDGDVVGRVSEHESRIGTFEQAIVGRLVPGIPAKQGMVT